MSKIISIENLSLFFQGREVLQNISLDIFSGDYLALAGPNGAGKTTLIKAILSLEKINTGNLSLFGQDISRFNDWSKIAYLPQKHQYNPLFPASILEVVLSGFSGMERISAKARREKAFAILSELDLDDSSHKLFSRLSGGQQQRVLLARALLRNPQLLILDEPTTALDPQIREKFFSLLAKYNKEQGTTIIMVTHDTADIGRYAKRLAYLDQSLLFAGDFMEFCHSEKMKKYFGDYSQHLICHQH